MKIISPKLKEKMQAFGDVLRALPQMARLLLRAQTWYVLALIAIQAVQGLVPLLTAWIAKELFDLLAHTIQQRQAAAHALPFLFLLLAAQAGTFLLSQALTAPGQYFQDRLNLKLSVVLKTSMYEKIAGFAGLAYFEDANFYDRMELITQNPEAEIDCRVRPLTIAPGMARMNQLHRSLLSLLFFPSSVTYFCRHFSQGLLPVDRASWFALDSGHNWLVGSLCG